MDQSTVLVIDDDTDHRTISATILRHHGFNVLEAADGKRGLQLALEHLPQAVLMDVRLPLLDGWTATEVLKGDRRTRHIPIIIFTAYALEPERLRSLAAGADCYLRKPCEPMEIVREVQRCLSPPAKPVPPMSMPHTSRL